MQSANPISHPFLDIDCFRMECFPLEIWNIPIEHTYSDTAMGFSLDQYLLFCLIMKFYLLELSSLHFKAILSCHYSTLHDLETSK